MLLMHWQWELKHRLAEVKECSWLKTWVINNKGRKSSYYIAFKIHLQQYKYYCLSHTLQSFTDFGDELFILRTFWSWDYRRNFTKYKTFILWLKRKGLYHSMRQKMNWAGRKRNRCLEKRSKGLLFVINIAAIDFYWEEL